MEARRGLKARENMKMEDASDGSSPNDFYEEETERKKWRGDGA